MPCWCRGGAASRDEFEQRARSFARRTLLHDQRDDADRDLAAICASHTDLALVEADLEQFDARENSDHLVRLKTELADVDRELESAFEHLASVKREIDALENDTRATQVRFELRQLEDQLRSRAREWMVCTTATQTIDELRRDFERSHQPLALAEAGRIFSRLTCGKYLRVWTPLGERRLVVSDALGNSFPIQSLSRSTREQLLLAVRLAVVVELGRQGISMPLILDDVLVNFDEERARAAADVLLELGEQGHQILFFTCHSHLTQLFAERGIESIPLPHQPHLLLERDESRLAG